ncbi:MAG: diguanylate cyclase (GGDEF)-like protein/PAS domain S-box-containing protein [Sulfurimonas sp.]|jgi:diguanylate cyclase (GGDEF)-like protein/PAS domain S-box-containing protein|uniref:sensor domain-containing diguanylate cyclase n=1 Tax=Sulfurimonas sp. TaxID=2022749 RepID=UPI0039E69DAA
MIVAHRDFFDEPMFKTFLDTFENSIDSVVITSTSPEEYFLYVNKVFKQKTGYEEDDLVGKSPRILQGPLTNRRVIDELKQNLQDDKYFLGQNTNYRKNGSSYIVKWSISALKNTQNETIAYISFQKEVTQSVWDHKQAHYLASVVNQNKDGDIDFYVSVGQDITSLINKSDEYKSKAYHDSLTGLYNRQKFDEIIERKYSDFLKNEQSFSIILMDIDNFKYVNNTFGHDNGDKVLKDLARLLHKSLRKDDLIARWGGEEFIVVVDNTMAFTTTLAEKIRETIKQELIIYKHNITMSLGVSEISQGDTIETLFTRVDKALYMSKKSGKNKVTSLKFKIFNIRITQNFFYLFWKNL